MRYARAGGAKGVQSVALRTHPLTGGLRGLARLVDVEHPDAFITACAAVLKPGGALFGLTLNRLGKPSLMGHLSFRAIRWRPGCKCAVPVSCR